jgi:hypothetical protein
VHATKCGCAGVRVCGSQNMTGERASGSTPGERASGAMLRVPDEWRT